MPRIRHPAICGPSYGYDTIISGEFRRATPILDWVDDAAWSFSRPLARRFDDFRRDMKDMKRHFQYEDDTRDTLSPPEFSIGTSDDVA